jgi:hypothetical protein
MTTEDKQWFSNKDLYTMFNKLQLSLSQMQLELQTTQKELQATQVSIRQYNGLREELAEQRRRIDAWEARNSGKAAVADGIRTWGGWILAILSFVWTVYRTTR